MLACRAANEDELRELAEELAVPLRVVGSAGGATVLGVELERLREAFAGETFAGRGGD